MIINDNIFLMLVEKFFKTFTKKEISNTTRDTEAIMALSSESIEKIVEIYKMSLKLVAKNLGNHKIIDICMSEVFRTLMVICGK